MQGHPQMSSGLQGGRRDSSMQCLLMKQAVLTLGVAMVVPGY